MIPYSAAFDKAMKQGTKVAPQLTLSRFGVNLLTVPVLPGGTVAFDETQPSRSSLQCQIADSGGLAPHVGTDPLAPYSVEGIVTIGLTLADFSVETKQIGVYRLNISTADTNGLITVSGPDRSAVVAAAAWEAPYTIPALTPLDVAIGTILAFKYPALPFVPDPAAHAQLLGPIPTVYQEGSTSGDPWQNCIDLATEFGRELFIDYLGRAILQPIPDPDATLPCYTYIAGETGNLGLSGSHTIDTSQNVYNVFSASGDGSVTVTDPVTGVIRTPTASVEITDQTSPIFPNPNGFGRRPLFITAPELTTDALCQQAAQGANNRKSGSDNQIQFTAIPHPCHVPGDVVTYESKLLGLRANLVLSAWTLDIGMLAASSYTTRLTTLGIVTTAPVATPAPVGSGTWDGGDSWDSGDGWDN